MHEGDEGAGGGGGVEGGHFGDVGAADEGGGFVGGSRAGEDDTAEGGGGGEGVADRGELGEEGGVDDVELEGVVEGDGRGGVVGRVGVGCVGDAWGV